MKLFSAPGVDNSNTKILFEVVNFLNRLTTFLLSLFASLTLARWRTLRHSCVQEVWTNVCHLATLSAAYLSDTPEKRERGANIVRYARLGFSLLFKEARGDLLGQTETGNTNNERAIVDKDLKAGEWEEHFLPAEGSKAAIPFVLAFCEVTKAVENGEIPSSLRSEFQGKCLKGREALSNTLSHVYTQLPLIYVHLIVALVKLSMIMLHFLKVF